MAITDTKQAKDFTAGAPKITLEGDLRPNQMMAGSSRYQIILDELINEMEEALGRPITNDEYDKLGKEAYEKLYESSISTEQNQMMASDGGRAQYGLGSFVKSIGKAVKGVAKGVTGAVKDNPLLALAALNFAPMIGGGAPIIGFGKTAGSLATIPGFPSPKTEGGKFLKNFVIGTLATGALAAAEAGGLDTSDPNAEIDVESLKSYLRTGYQNLNPSAQPMEVERFVEANVAEYNSGGRVGYSDGTPSFEEYMRERKGIEQKMNMERLYKEYLEDLRRKKVADQKTMAAAGGRMGVSTDDRVMAASGIEGLPININSKGIKELDLRKTGGFIPPVGVKEKADDIPAMLSNNEFVFTADAVRAAGGGDVNKGAEIMYDTMKKLESRIA